MTDAMLEDPDAKFAHMDDWTSAQLHERMMELQKIPASAMTDDQLEEATRCHALARRKSAGPPKTKKAPVTVSDSDLDDLLA